MTTSRSSTPASASAAGTSTEAPEDAQQFWEKRYRGGTQPGRGRPNAVFAGLVAGLPTGAALDLGCGPGGDTLWLAGRGWTVTAVDISPTALAGVRADADAAGLEDRVRTEHHDLSVSFPEGRFDLVSAQFLQTPLAFPRRRVLRRAAEAVAPGGLLLIVEHARSRRGPRGPSGPGAADRRRDAGRARPGGRGLARVEIAETRHREATGPDGETATVDDNVIAARRRA